MDSVALKNAVLANLSLNDTDNAAVVRFQVYENLTLAQRQISLTFPVRVVDDAVKSFRFNVVSGQSSYQWQDDHLRLLNLYVDWENTITDANPGVEVREAEGANLSPFSLDARPSKLFPRYKLVKNGFEIKPVPSASVDKGFRVKYVQNLQSLDKDTDCLLKDSLENAMIAYATYLCALIDNYSESIAISNYKRFIEIKKEFFEAE